MAINYTPVGWNSSSYYGPTNMNHMDDGIKAACDGVDALETELAATNESLENLPKTKIVSNVSVFSLNENGKY